ncbi:MAG: hypothetical protein NTX74_06675 [Flavobacterium sp.]|nr:hypothetical protein [Flavobacterium sp.]
MKHLINFLYNSRFHLLIIAFGIAWMGILNGMLQLSDQTFIYPDSFSYFDAATDLSVKLRGHCYRPIGMAFISGLPYVFGAEGTAIFGWSFYVNVACWLSSAVVIFTMLKQQIATNLAFLSALVFLLCVGPATICFHLLTENCYTFLMLLFLFFWDRYQNSKRYLFLSIGLSVLLFSMLVKPGSKFLAVLVLVYAIKIIYQHRKSKSTWIIYGAMALIAVQLGGMKAQFGNATLSYIDGITYHNYLCTKAVCYQEGVPYHQINNERAAYLHQFSLPERKVIAAADFKQQLTHNTLNLFKAYCSNVWDNTISGSPYIQDCENRNQTTYFEGSKSFLFSVSKWQNRFFTSIGLIFALYTIVRYKHARKTAVMTSVVLLYTVVLSGVSCSQGDRFHLVIYPFAILLLGQWILLWRKKKAFN